MTRILIAIVIAALVGACAAPASGGDKDPVREKLFAAKVAYDKEMAAFRKAAGEWLDRREDAARKAGDKKLVDQIKEERKAFDEGGELPKAAPTAIRQKPTAARKVLEAAYADAVKAYVKAKKDDEAAAVEKELGAFLKGAGAIWTVTFRPGAYAAGYDGGVKATIELRKDGTFTRTRDGKQYPGTVSSTDGKLVLKSDEFVEVWTAAGGTIKVEHWWPANTYPKGKAQSKGTAARAKE
jgi:hypothetical protein